MKKYSVHGLLAIVSLFSFVVGLEYKHLTEPLDRISPHITSAVGEATVIVSAEALTSWESKSLFGHNLIARGVIPLEISIHNNTAHAYSVGAHSVDFSHLDPKKVASIISKSALPRAIGWKICAFLFWPLMIPSTIDEIRTRIHYRDLRKLFYAKSFKREGEILPPYSAVHRIVFVPKESVEETFTLTIVDLKTGEEISVETHLNPATSLSTHGEGVSTSEGTTP